MWREISTKPTWSKLNCAMQGSSNVMIKINVAKMEVVSTMPVGTAAMFLSIKEGIQFPNTE